MNLIIGPSPKLRKLALTVSMATLLVGASPTLFAARYQGLEPDQFMTRWLVLRPIPVAEGQGPDDNTQRETFAADLLAEAGGEQGVRPGLGSKVSIRGKELVWGELFSATDLVDLKVAPAPEEFSIAYAWAEIELPRAMKGLLGIGSDDGVKVWLNGQLIHENWTDRPTRADDDLVPAAFVEGENRLLLKIQNRNGPWGFACRLLSPDSQAKKLIAAAWEGELDQVKRLLKEGVEVDAQNSAGLTAWQAAKLRGRPEVAEILAKQGSDTRASLPSRAKLAASLFESRFGTNTPAAAVLVAQHGTVLFENAYGLANLEQTQPATTRTQFRIGSVSKQFIAAAILKLAEDGKLSVRDKLSKFIPDYPRGDEVTIHHLLTHTSGIHSYTSKPEFFEKVTEGATPEEHIQSFRDDPYDFDPGERWLYNNSGFFLLGYIIELVSGQDYGAYLRQTFFEPLGMHHSGVHQADARPDQEAIGYSFSDGKFERALDWDMSKAGGAGALYSTVGDLHRWNEAVFGGRVLQPSSLAAAFTPVKTTEAPEDQETGYGYGWGITKFRGAQEIAHGGGLHGFLSYLLRLPTEDFTVAVLINCSPAAPGADPSGLSHDLVEIFLGDKLPARPVLVADTSLSAAALDTVVGRYQYPGAIMIVSRQGERVFAQLTGQPRHEIFPRTTTNFFWKVVEAEVTFVQDAQGRVTQAIHHQGGQTFRAPKLADLTEIELAPNLLEAYVGRYDYGGGKAIMVITRDRDRLFAQLTGQPKAEIFPKSETEFVWKLVDAQITFVKDDSGKVTKAIHEQSGRKFDAPRL